MLNINFSHSVAIEGLKYYFVQIVKEKDHYNSPSWDAFGIGTEKIHEK
jgi:hypothetical protein